MQELSLDTNFWFTALALGFAATLWFAMAALPCLAGTACLKSCFAGTKRAMYLLLARQLAWLGNALTWFFLGVGSAAALTLPVMTDIWATPVLRTALLGMGAFGSVAAVTGTLILALWGTLRKHPLLLTLLHLVVAMAFVGLFVLLSGALHSSLPEDLQALPQWLMRYRLFILALLVPCLAAGAGAGLLWLVVRRAYDDFGRDYYVFAARFCAFRAVFGALILAGFSGYLTWNLFGEFATSPENMSIQNEALGWFGIWTFWLLGDVLGDAASLTALMGLVVGLPVVAALIWGVVGVSTAPMRAKLAMVAAALCLVGSLVAGVMILALRVVA